MKKLLTILLFLGLSFTQVMATEDETTTDAASQSARALYAQNEIDEALKILKSKGEETRSAEDWLLIGNILQDKDPKYYKAHYNLGYIYLIKEQPNMALAEFKKSVKYKPDFAYGYYNMGCAYLKLKQYGSAKYNFFRAIDLKNDEPSFYYNLAYAYKMMGKEKQAKTYLDLYNKLMERG